jgi:hypothetical protein
MVKNTVPKRSQELDPQLEALIQEHLLSNERVLDARIADNKAKVRLIWTDLDKERQETTNHRRHRWGGGRTLGFELRDGEWHFLWVGGWRS